MNAVMIRNMTNDELLRFQDSPLASEEFKARFMGMMGEHYDNSSEVECLQHELADLEDRLDNLTSAIERMDDWINEALFAVQINKAACASWNSILALAGIKPKTIGA